MFIHSHIGNVERFHGTPAANDTSVAPGQSAAHTGQDAGENHAGWSNSAYCQSGGQIAGKVNATNEDLRIGDVCVNARLHLTLVSGNIDFRQVRSDGNADPLEIATMTGNLLLGDVAVPGNVASTRGHVSAANVDADTLAKEAPLPSPSMPSAPSQPPTLFALGNKPWEGMQTPSRVFSIVACDDPLSC
ncbi:hypothetical protein [Undibacterium sp. CCC3.4]|nr:hypothetical protein [Undibacterium sp. CCC3.4]WPX45135.1 hypothetical protein RHM61_07905 [Undibacterium sp. CCC3.4]